MTWTLGTSGVINPVQDGGYGRSVNPIGGTFEMADGSLGVHKVTTRKEYEVVWRVKGTDYTGLIGRTDDLYYVPGTVGDHLGNTETMMVVARNEDLMKDNATREVRVTFQETTG